MEHSKQPYIYVNDKHKIEFEIQIPYEDCIEELSNFLMVKYNLPFHLDESMQARSGSCKFSLMIILGLKTDVHSYINKCNVEYFNNEATDLIDNVKADSACIDTIAKEWEKLMKEVRENWL